MSVTTSDPAQPSLLEKKKNTYRLAALRLAINRSARSIATGMPQWRSDQQSEANKSSADRREPSKVPTTLGDAEAVGLLTVGAVTIAV